MSSPPSSITSTQWWLRFGCDCVQVSLSAAERDRARAAGRAPPSAEHQLGDHGRVVAVGAADAGAVGAVELVRLQADRDLDLRGRLEPVAVAKVAEVAGLQRHHDPLLGSRRACRSGSSSRARNRCRSSPCAGSPRPCRSSRSIEIGAEHRRCAGGDRRADRREHATAPQLLRASCHVDAHRHRRRIACRTRGAGRCHAVGTWRRRACPGEWPLARPDTCRVAPPLCYFGHVMDIYQRRRLVALSASLASS